MQFLLLILRVLVGFVFVYSGFSKLIAPVENFMSVIGGYQFVPSHLIPHIALTLPWLELILGSFLLMGFMTRLSAFILSLFSLSFVILLARSILLHLPIAECGCFGAGITLAPSQALALDACIFLICLLIVLSRFQKWSLDQWLLK